MSHATDLAKISQTLVEEAKQNHSHALLLLPSTSAAFTVVEQCVAAGLPMKIVGNASWMASWAPALAQYVQSPLALWHAVKDDPALPSMVAVFQDQLTNIDGSYRTTCVRDQKIRVSPIEAMLVMRFHPRTYVATAIAGRPGKLSSLALTAHTVPMPEGASPLEFDAALSAFLRPAIECQTQAIGDWRARNAFSLKVGSNFERMLSQHMREIEALIRVHQDRQGAPSSLTPSLEQLRASHKELVSHIR